MAYFSKEIYERKREYAYSISNEGLEKIATYIVAENPKYKNADLNDEEISNEIDNSISELIEELKPIADLSHKRHEIHSTDRRHYLTGNGQKELSETGDVFSDGCLIDDVNALNKKYNLVESTVSLIKDGTIPTDDDSSEYIFDYFGKDFDKEKDEDDTRADALELLYYGWNDILNNWSEGVRAWFGLINEKFGTDFPC